MANKKVSQLTSKPSVLTTDLFPIADPSTGQLYKTTISDLGTAIGSGVSSVNGLVGAVVLDTDDIQELVSPTNKWFTDTRARAALSASSPLTYNSGTGAFGIQVATGSQNGYLSSTDWTTFNNKIGGSGITDYYARFTDTKVVSDGFIRTTSNITYVEGMGLSTGNGLDIEGNYGAGGGGLKIRSYDETTGNAYIDFSNTGGRMYLGVNRSTASGLMTNATAYATVLTTGLGTTNLEFGTNATKRLTIDGASGGVGIGTDSLTGYNLRVSKNLTGASNSYGILQDSTIQSDVTNAYINTSNPSIAASSTIGSLYHYRAFLPSIGAGSTINAQYGFSVQSSMTGASANYGFWGGLASASGVWNIYMSGSANNYLSGNLLIGSSTDNSYKLQVTGDVDIAKNDRANGAVLRLTNSFNGSGWIAGDIIGSLIFYSSDTSAPANRGALRSISESGSTNSSITGLSFETYSSSVLSQKMYLTGAGNLLIGSTADNGSKLQVTGAATFSSSVTATSLALNGSIANSGDSATLTIKQTSTSYNNGIYLERGGERNGYHMYIGGALDSLTFRRNYFGTQGDVMSLTRDGNVGIGTTSPYALLSVYGASAGDRILIDSNSGSGSNGAIAWGAGSVPNISARIKGTDDGAYGTHLIFETRGNGATGTTTTERMRITSGGDLLVGTTSDTFFGGSGSTGIGLFGSNGFIAATRSGAVSGIFGRYTSTGDVIQFRYSGTAVGSISVTGSATAYNTSSDYRLKEDLKPINGLEIVNKIKVYDYKWKASDNRMDGVLAHELAEVLPYAVTGVKDGELMQGVDYSKIVPVMVQAIKELKAELDTLKNK